MLIVHARLTIRLELTQDYGRVRADTISVENLQPRHVHYRFSALIASAQTQSTYL